MTWARDLCLSWRALTRAPWRTLLSASSLAVGIAAVVLLFGVGGGAERAFQEAIEGMGRNLLAIGSELKESGALRGAASRYQTLTLADSQAIAWELESVARVAPIAMNNFDLRYGGRSSNVTVIGTTPDFRVTNNQILAAGRFLDDFDLEQLARVAVIGARVVDDLFFGEQPLGERLLVGGVPFTVVGVLREKGADMTGSTEDDRVLVPVLTAQRRLLDVDFVDRIFVQAVSEDELERAAREVRSLLRSRHGLEGSIAPDDFTVSDQAALLAALEDSDRSFSRLLAGLAALALGLGCTGLLAVSLLSVRERSNEIGLRLAVGALPRQILQQFLAETGLVGGLGGCLGLLVGGVGIIVGQRVLGWQLALTWESVTYPFLISLGVSLVFGVYPAMRAARLDPIVALRSE